MSFVDVFKQKVLKIKGSAELAYPGDECFAEWHAPLKTLAGERFTIRAVICVRVAQIEPILAPSYQFFPDTTEAGQEAGVLAAYGVQRLKPDNP